MSGDLRETVEDTIKMWRPNSEDHDKLETEALGLAEHRTGRKEAPLPPLPHDDGASDALASETVSVSSSNSALRAVDPANASLASQPTAGSHVTVAEAADRPSLSKSRTTSSSSSRTVVRVPTGPRSRVIWFLRQVRDSYLNEPGAYISVNVFLPTSVWHMTFVEQRVTRLLKERTKLLAKLIKVRTQSYDDKAIRKLDREVQAAFRNPLVPYLEQGGSNDRLESHLNGRRPKTGFSNWFKNSNSSLGKGTVASSMGGAITTSSTHTAISGGADIQLDSAGDPNNPTSLFLDAASFTKSDNASSAASTSEEKEASSVLSDNSQRTLTSSMSLTAIRAPSRNKEAEAVLAGYAGVIGELAHAALQEGYGGVTERFMTFVADVVCPKVILDVFDLLQIFMDNLVVERLLQG